MSFDGRDRPNRIPWPPLIGAAAVVAALAGARVFPMGVPFAPLARPLGWALIAAGLALVLWAIATFRRARTNLMPNRGADRLVVDGPFAFTRNPIYLGEAILFVGVGGATGSLWFVVAALVMTALIDLLAVRREEVHLALRFGEAWAAYAARIPRWIGPRRKPPAPPQAGRGELNRDRG
jgi:protein-S-isoprenylcysteine O-methyltransferase Ste14